MMHSHCCLQLNRLKPLVVLILVVMDDALAQDYLKRKGELDKS